MRDDTGFLDYQLINFLNKISTVLPYATSVLLGIILLIMVVESPKIVIIAFISLFLLIFTALSVERLFYFFAFYIITFEEPGLSVYFPGIPIVYMTFAAAAIFLFLVAYWLIYTVSNRIEIEWHKVEKTILVLLIAVCFSCIYGVLRGHLFGNILEDFLPLFFFAAYFIVRYSPLNLNYSTIYKFFLFCSILVSLQFIYAAGQFRGSIFLTRIVSQHIHMAQFAIPYLGANFIYSEHQRTRLLSLFLIPPIIIAVFISQQRALWFTIFLTIFILTIMAFYRFRKQIRSKIRRIFIIIFALLVISPFLFSTINNVLSTNVILTMLIRSSVFLSPQFLKYDESANIRIGELKDTFEEIKNDLVFGTGLGDVRITRWRDTKQLTVDNSYVYLLWKMGIIGLLPFLCVYIIFFKHAFHLIAKPLKSTERIIIVTSILNFIGMFIVALSNASISHYRFIFVWSIMIAAVESIYRKYV